MCERIAEAVPAECRPVEPPDGGAAWRALYEDPEPVVEPVEDDEADVEGGEDPRTAGAAEVLDHAPRAVAMTG